MHGTFCLNTVDLLGLSLCMLLCAKKGLSVFGRKATALCSIYSTSLALVRISEHAIRCLVKSRTYAIMFFTLVRLRSSTKMPFFFICSALPCLCLRRRTNGGSASNATTPTTAAASSCLSSRPCSVEGKERECRLQKHSGM